MNQNNLLRGNKDEFVRLSDRIMEHHEQHVTRHKNHNFQGNKKCVAKKRSRLLLLAFFALFFCISF